MGKLDINKMSFWVTVCFIIVAPIENIVRSEQIVYAICILSLGICVLQKGSLLLNKAKYIIFLIIYMLATSLWSTEEQFLDSLLVVYAELIFLFLQLQFRYTCSDYHNIKASFLIQNFILLILCITNGTYMDGRFWLKSTTSGVDPNYLAGWFVIPLCFSIEFLFSEKIKTFWKWGIILQIAFSMYFIMQTASKSGFITNICIIAFATLYTAKHLIKKYPLHACGIFIAFLIGCGIVLDTMPSYLIERLLNGDTTGTGRFPMWVTLVGEMLDHPIEMLVGFGTGSVKYYTGTGLVSHNTYLDLLFNEGLIGFSAFMGYIFTSIKSKINRYPYIIISFLGMSILLFTLSAFNTRFFMLMLFLIGMDIDRNTITIDLSEETNGRGVQ